VRGVVAAGHPLTAEAGANILREGGNAVDAAVCAVLASFAAESPLTGLGAGGFMLIHDPSAQTGSEQGWHHPGTPASGQGRITGPPLEDLAEDVPGTGGDVLIDFFVQAPGLGGIERRSELVPIDVYFEETPQTFNIGAASCGVPGTPAGLAHALGRFGTAPLQELVKPAIEMAWEGTPVNAMQAYIFSILSPILTRYEECRALYAPAGRTLAEGDTFRFPELAEALERFGAEGPEPFYSGEVGAAVADRVAELGGTLSLQDMAAYEAIERPPVRVAFRDTEVLSNPPPSAGGILIALCLALLERLGDAGVEATVAAMGAAQESRGKRFQAGLYEDGFADLFLDPEKLDETAAALRGSLPGGGAAPGDDLGSTTHLAVIDSEGRCASVTCSNGSGSGVVVPSTGVHLNNMLGEQDLNPHGFHLTPAGRRMPSMMAPTVVKREAEVIAGLGSAGSNRIRSAILQTVLRLLFDGMNAAEAVLAPRVHFEEGVVQAEPGVDPVALARLEERGTPVARWGSPNLYFGGVQAVARDPADGTLEGGGDPRRGGAVVVVD
jgi:gamma-glutamyltranspeptidase / glutathione hydrolase